MWNNHDKGTKAVLMNKYGLNALVGEGSFGKVYRATNMKSGQTVAIKVLDKQRLTKEDVRHIQKEISIMKSLRYPNIVELYEVMATKKHIFLVMEYVSGGDLYSRVEEKGKLGEEEARKYFQQLVAAVDFCHSRGVSHRDLKLENLLLDGDGNLKVTDFGLSAAPEDFQEDGLIHARCGTPEYAAPEVVTETGKVYGGAEADVWSCGVILYILLAGYFPFQDEDIWKLYEKIKAGKFACPAWFSGEVRDLLFRLLDQNPATRITVPDLMEVPWVRRGLEPAAAAEKLLENEREIKPQTLNAFEIISMSEIFDLSRLFSDAKTELRFTSRKPAPEIISKIEKIGKGSSFNTNKEECALNLQRCKAGRKGRLGVEAKIYELAPSVFEVEVRKKNGDTIEYKKFCEQELRPGLQDIVWAWKGPE